MAHAGIPLLTEQPLAIRRMVKPPEIQIDPQVERPAALIGPGRFFSKGTLQLDLFTYEHVLPSLQATYIPLSTFSTAQP